MRLETWLRPDDTSQESESLGHLKRETQLFGTEGAGEAQVGVEAEDYIPAAQQVCSTDLFKL